MEYVLSLPKSNESYFRLLLETVKAWFRKKRRHEVEENFYLIN